ncbi:TrbG/VirB9 family P-type conjugative transfer protein [Burkholderia sp. Ac-20365]|uniref:TrbG/VirB9 family P-type conjugative transfer protein n=1 Tax=Burkholderia sp. Ac-20365 TaxID=2703897 RepID=UPI00197C5B54|nr:TrbG/VirB9 family P-type conjugative transfer protein [Burkholderia sp. Ac-20365]MBN3761064.1 TrbG/VirB9 family P-type conjugative transfer protein [Burkholderia sp. Ac-20365]
MVAFASVEFPIAVHAAGPLDFGYAVDGPAAVRPVLVFNDGTDTYIQPAPHIPTTVKGGVQDGPYLRAPGLPDQLTVRAGRYSMVVTHSGAPSAGAGATPSRGLSNGLRSVSVPPQPAGPRAVGLNVVSAPATAPDAIEKVAMSIAAKDAIGGGAGPVAASGAHSGVSLLAKNFGAQAIRDSDDLHTQIKFAAKQAALSFTTPDGKSLAATWDTSGNVVTIDRAPRFIVSNGQTSVEVGRTSSNVYQFDVAGPAHLEAVFDSDGATYFKFAPSVVKVTVEDVNHAGSGEQKGNFYRFKGVADQFIVVADGKTANVTRKLEVKYFERLAQKS